jgi:ubiquinone biosynthesis protein
MAIREDILPKNITEELKQLLDNLPEVPFEEIQKIIEESLGSSLKTLFLDIKTQPLASASIGQTHRATTRNGQPVVVKVIKPGIRETILSDLKLLQILGNVLEWIIPRYQPRVIIEEFCTYTRREIDLVYEADHAELFAANFADTPQIVFPKIYREYCSRDVLCMEYFDGIKPNDRRIFDFGQKDLNKIIDYGIGAIIKMLFEDAFFHADLHAANLVVMPGPKVGFIDLGMVGRFEEKTKRSLLYYFFSLVNGDIERSVKHLLSIAKFGRGGDPAGFKRAVSDLLRRYLIQASYGNFSLAKLILESLAIGGKYRVFFPVEMTLMVKALVTYEGVGHFLNPRLDVPGLSKKHISKIYKRFLNPEHLWKELVRSVPELLDVAIQLPKLITDGSRAIDEFLSESHRENPLVGIKSSLIAGSCIVGGVIALVQGGPPLLWIGLFASSVLFFLFGK